jgi:hypothetical protein
MSESSTLTRSTFQLDVTGPATFSGHSTGTGWNGWALPHFTFDVAQRIVEAIRLFQDAHYDAIADEFVFETPDGDEERFGAVEIKGLGKLYPIGAGSWIWEEAGAD